MLRSLQAGLLVVPLCATPACASQGRLYRYPSAPRVTSERAYAIGYNEGRLRGEQDARRRRSFNYQRHRDYRAADSGYRGYGSGNAYRSLFRQGFIAGYNDGYRRDARLGHQQPGGPYLSRATEYGYRDGFQQGRSDARNGQRFDPVRARRYRAADHDYNRRYGPRDDYKRAYRAAFQGGYEEGYYGGPRRY